MSFSLTIVGQAANPDEERRIREMAKGLLEDINVEMDVNIIRASFTGQYGAEDFLASPEGDDGSSGAPASGA